MWSVCRSCPGQGSDLGVYVLEMGTLTVVSIPGKTYSGILTFFLLYIVQLLISPFINMFLRVHIFFTFDPNGQYTWKNVLWYLNLYFFICKE